MSAVTSDFGAFVTPLEGGLKHLDLAVEGIHCAGCMRKIENGISALPGVTLARVNLTEKRLAVEWQGDSTSPAEIIGAMRALGFPAHPFDPGAERDLKREDRKLLRCLAVAGFATANIMLLSVSVWSGNATDINPETRALFHWVSALIALPAGLYAGRPFFESAFAAIKARSLNMDVPISVAVVLTLAASVMQTMRHEVHAYFDSALMLLFFLLIGRYLDQMMRRRTRAHAETLLALKGDSARRLDDDGIVRDVPLSALSAGDMVVVSAGERFPADGRVSIGTAEIDQSLVTGETDPVKAAPGQMVYAGVLNLTGNIQVKVTAAGSGTLLDEINRLLERALEAKSKQLQLADRAAKLYAPVVHLLALAAFIGWLLLGADWHTALMIAVATLIITCPCALGLAIPAAQVVASGALFRAGLVLNTGTILERLAEVDTVVFDKTGTLTLPERGIINAGEVPAGVLARAAALAQASRHPLAQVVAQYAEPGSLPEEVIEHAGQGVWCAVDGEERRLGSSSFCGLDTDEMPSQRDPHASQICYIEGNRSYVFEIGQRLREDAAETISALKARGLRLEILSGDREEAVQSVATALAVNDWYAGLSPTEKIARLGRLKDAGRKVLMVGDGLNDAPALAAAHASLSPISAVHVSQAAADGLILGDRLGAVTAAYDTALKARAVMGQNLWLSALYNVIAVPIAVLGFVTPLIAALAMSGSSIIVTLNSLRARAHALSTEKASAYPPAAVKEATS